MDKVTKNDLSNYMIDSNMRVIKNNRPLRPLTEELLQGTKYFSDEFLGVLISQEELSARIKEMALTIKQNYSPRDSYLVWLKNGAKTFFDELYGNGLDDFSYDGFDISSYNGTTSGEIKVGEFDFSKTKGKNVLFIEDIVDTGTTAFKSEEIFLNEGAASVAMATLALKRTPLSTGYVPIIAGFSIPDAFIIGYNLDYNQEYRGLPFIGVISPIGIAKYAKEELLTEK